MDEGKKRIVVLSVSSLLLVAMVVAAVVGLVINKNADDGNSEVSTSTKAIKTLCESVDYQDTCVKGLSSKEYNQTDDRSNCCKNCLDNHLRKVCSLPFVSV